MNDTASSPSDARPLLLDYLAHRQVIGYLGMALPVVLILGGLALFSEGWQSSLSAYYHTGMRNVFVGVLFVLGFFFFSYRGYDETDRRAALVAFVGALGVALFPTSNGDGTPGWVGAVHYASALALFAALIFFTRQFQKSKPGEPISQVKRNRNRVYRICGGLMTAAIVGMVLYKAAELLALLPQSAAELLAKARPIFMGETLAIEAFGVSWWVKGQALAIFRDPDE